jgi:hypothetical protein
MDMNDQELEKMLLETLRISKESREYLIKIDRRQRWQRNWKAFYWAIIIVAALCGAFYAFPYLKEARDQVGGVFSQISSIASFTNSSDTAEAGQ